MGASTLIARSTLPTRSSSRDNPRGGVILSSAHAFFLRMCLFCVMVVRMGSYGDFVTILSEACEQDGIITRAQMHRLGVRDDAIRRMCANENGLRHVLRGVYVVPALACGYMWDMYALFFHALEPSLFLWEKRMPQQAASFGALSHFAAATMHGCTVVPDDVHLTAPKRRSIYGAYTHTSVLDSEDITIIDGLPVTTLERTTRDLGAIVMDGEHRARWMDFLYLEHGWTREKITSLIGERATDESLHHCLHLAA